MGSERVISAYTGGTSASSNLASNARMRSSLAAGAKRDAMTVTSEVGLQRLAAVQRSVEKNRVDYWASRPDPTSVEARLLHGTAA